MQFRKAAYVLILSALLPAPLFAADFGVGADLLAGGANVALPLRFKSLLVEPELSWSQGSSDTSIKSGSGTSGETIDDYTSIGVGVYRLGALLSTKGYYGLRAGFFSGQNDIRDTAGNITETDRSGWFVAPVIGAEYLFNKDFAVALDLGLEYTSYSDETRTGTGSTLTGATTTDGTELGMNARVMVRTWF